MKKKLGSLLALGLLTIAASAQKTQTDEAAFTHYEAALQLYTAGMYGSARTAFDRFLEQNPATDHNHLCIDASYYRAVSAKKLGNGDALTLMEQFVADYPQSAHRHEMLYHIGDYHLAAGDESTALKWFEQAKPSMVEQPTRSDLIFKTGYCNFMLGKENRALACFEKLKGNEGKYAGAITYYKGHVDYKKGNLDAALKAMLSIEKDAGFSNVAPYYIAHIFYLQGHYAEAIRYATPLASGSKTLRAAEMTRIVADSHFMLGEYADAVTQYERLTTLTRKTTRADYYHLGMSHYYLGHYDMASQNLSQVTSERDALAQNAYYHLADCHLKLNDKKRARVAFEAASKLDFDKAVQEDAAFNRLKLNYELNYAPFNDLIKSFVDFIDKFPDSDKRDQAYDYMSKAFVTSKNYREALQTMEKIKHKNLNIYTAMQRLAFYRGLELYTDTQYDEAIEFFDYSLKYGEYDPRLKARAYYWKGDSYYRKRQIAEAEQEYMKFINSYGASELPEFVTAHYNMGYTRFNVKQYPDALDWFRKFVSLGTTDKPMLADAYNRMGDCQFVSRDFQHAIVNYNMAIEASHQVGDYSMLQKGICMGLAKDYRGKVGQLEQLIKEYPQSPYCDNAYYEIGRAYVAMDLIKEAIYNYKIVKERYPKGSLAPKAMLQLGLLYYNNGEYDNSMAFYKRVVNEYPSTPEAIDALAGLKNVYMEKSDFEGYLAYTQTLGSFARLDMQEQDSLMFVSAERLYLKGDFANALTAFEKYLAKFADGRFTLNANYYSGDCLYRQERYSEALKAFSYVASQPRSTFTEDAMLREGEILYASNDYADALSTFERLEREAEVETNKTEAIIGQMRCLKQSGDLNRCIEAADKVIAIPQASPEIVREAEYLKAKSLIDSRRATEAVPTLRKLSMNTKSAEGAEAKYLVAQIMYDMNQHETAEKEIFDYIEKGTPHQYWLARSFVLLADIYHAKGEDFQALQYLESLRDNYNTEADDIGTLINTRVSQWNAGKASQDADPDLNLNSEY